MSDPTVVTDSSLVSIGVVAGVVGTLVTMAWKMRGLLSDILNRLKTIEECLEITRKSGFVKGHDLDTWIRILRETNPSMRIPDRVK